jgi:transglutaminase-like putative cysteine protease
MLSTIHASLEYEVRTPAHFCFHIEASQGPGQRVVSEQLSVSPDVAFTRHTDAKSGNRFVRLDAPVGTLVVSYKADVELRAQPLDEDLPEVALCDLPDDVFPFLLPSRYCESDALYDAAQQLFGKAPAGTERVRRIVQWIHDAIHYRIGSTGVTTSARDVFVQRAGVCRDFAHMGIALCRALNIPARIVAGYVWFDEPPQDFHAVFEAWLGGRWVMFDATGMAPVDCLVRIGTGADATDVAFATYFGDVELKRKEVSVLEHTPRTARAA